MAGCLFPEPVGWEDIYQDALMPTTQGGSAGALPAGPDLAKETFEIEGIALYN